MAGDVAITESGAMPAKLELAAAPAQKGPAKETAAAPKSAAAPAAPAATPAAATSKVRTSFE